MAQRRHPALAVPHHTRRRRYLSSCWSCLSRLRLLGRARAGVGDGRWKKASAVEPLWRPARAFGAETSLCVCVCVRMAAHAA